MHKKLRTKTFAPTECDDAPPVPLQNLEVYRTTIPDNIFGLSQHEDYWIGHPDDEVIFKKSANDAAIPWTGKTRFERVCPDKIFRDPTGGYNKIWVRPGRETRYQKAQRPFDVLPEQWTALGPAGVAKELAAFKLRAPLIAAAIANRTIPRVPCEYLTGLAMCSGKTEVSATSGSETESHPPTLVTCSEEAKGNIRPQMLAPTRMIFAICAINLHGSASIPETRRNPNAA